MIRDTGGQGDWLLGGRTDAAERVEIHSMTMDGGVMRMRALRNGIAVPPGGAVALKPGGVHLMLIGLKRPLRRGETVELRLRFERAGEVKARFRIEPVDHRP